jgi:hypothetical protein
VLEGAVRSGVGHVTLTPVVEGGEPADGDVM